MSIQAVIEETVEFGSSDAPEGAGGGGAGVTVVIGAQHVALVRRIARRMALPAHVDREDLEGAGLEALVKAASAHGPDDVPFEVYAAMKARYAMLDHLRSMDPASRRQRAAERSGQAVAVPTVVSLEADPMLAATLTGRCDMDVTARDPGELVESACQMDALRASLALLAPRLRQVLVESYLEERPGVEIARRMGLSAPRVSRLRKQALSALGQQFAMVEMADAC